jgi:hypothetical protein
MTQSRDAKTPLHVTIADATYRRLEQTRCDQQDIMSQMIESHIRNAANPEDAATGLAEHIAQIVGRLAEAQDAYFSPPIGGARRAL